MIAKDVNHGSHGLFTHAAATGRFIVIHPVSGMFVTDFAIIGGVHAPHEMMFTPMERLALSDKPGVLLFMKVLVDGPTGVGGTFFSAMHSLCHRARRADFTLWDLRLLPVLDF